MTEFYPIFTKAIDDNLEIHLVLTEGAYPFVTYLYNKEFGKYFSGHYFKTFPQALVDFRLRK